MKKRRGESVAEIIIIGAGLTGLSAAYHLEKQGFFDYSIVEQETKAGGLLRSVEENGFTFDYTGHLIHINNPYFREFLEDVTNLANFNLITRNAAIFSHNVLTDYPFQINLHGLPTEVAVECIEGYVQRAQHIKHPKNFYQWVLKHFGTGFGKHFFFQFNGKLLSYDLTKVHADQLGRFFPSTDLRLIIKGTLEKNPPAGIGYNSSFYYPKQGGIEFLIQQLKKQVTKILNIEHRVCAIDTINKIVSYTNGRTETYKTIISTMPLSELLPLIKTSSKTVLHNASQKLVCNTVININLGFSVDNIGNYHWLYFPERHIPFYRMGFWHNLNPTSAPAGKTAVYGEVSYNPKKTSLSQAKDITANTIKHMLNYLKLEPHHVIAKKILTIKHAYVIYDAWRQKNLPILLTTLKELSIHSTGRYGGWKYSGMQEAVLDGKDAAQSSLITLKKPQATIIPAQRASYHTQTLKRRKRHHGSHQTILQK